MGWTSTWVGGGGHQHGKVGWAGVGINMVGVGVDGVGVDINMGGWASTSVDGVGWMSTWVEWGWTSTWVGGRELQ